MFRDRVADRRVLIVLDDAAGEEQLRWLLPGTSTCAVIVTARSRLTGLAGARSYQLDVFTPDQALSLLVRILGPERVYAELASAMRLVKLCGGLALALRIAAARLASRPHWAIAQLVERLANERQRLDELIHGGLGVRANLALAYEGLPPPAQRLFRLLGMLESADFASWVAAPLLEVDIAEAEDTIELLVDAQLLDGQRVNSGLIRYRFHDLIRAYARERLAQQTGVVERTEAMFRLLGTWLFLAEEAHRREYGGDHTLVHGTAARWPLARWRVDHELAVPLEWFETERQNLVAAVRQAAGAGLDELCWDLALTAVTLFEARNYFDDWRVTHEVALAATRTRGNRRGEAAMVHSLGTLRLFEHRLDDASRQLATAVRLFGEVGDAHGEALARRNLAFADRVQGRLDAARTGFQRALATVREAGDWTAEAHILSNLAQISLECGQPAQAIDTLTDALVAVERSGNRRVHAQVLCRLGETHLDLADLVAAERAFRQALAAVHSGPDVVGEAHALYGLGMTLGRSGDHAQAELLLTRALGIAGRTGDTLVRGRILLARGELDVARGRPGSARAHLSAALGLFAQLRAARWRLRALRALSAACSAAGDPAGAAAADAELRAREAELDTGESGVKGPR
jgi:tetratricopeptide (TPR) repeat protein